MDKRQFDEITKLKRDIRRMYMEQGQQQTIPYLTSTIKKINNLPNTGIYDNQFKAQLRGTLAEEICLIMLAEYIKTYYPNKPPEQMPYILDSRYFKVGDKTTEIDIIFITPHKIFVFEVKSYYGELSIGKDGEIISKTTKQRVNPYTQNQYHIDMLRKALKGVLVWNGPQIFENYVFLFSDSRATSDKRTQEVKNNMVLCNRRTILPAIKHKDKKYSNIKIDDTLKLAREIIKLSYDDTWENLQYHIKGR